MEAIAVLNSGLVLLQDDKWDYFTLDSIDSSEATEISDRQASQILTIALIELKKNNLIREHEFCSSELDKMSNGKIHALHAELVSPY